MREGQARGRAVFGGALMATAVLPPQTARPATGRRTPPPPPRRRRRPLRLLRIVVLWMLLAVVVGGVAFGAGLLAAPADLSTSPPAKAALLLDAGGALVATITSPQVREEIAASDIPDAMRQAMVAAEDERFFDHNGVDPMSVLRAASNDLSGSRTQGGSTITQQYVKNTYVGSERNAARKIREAALAVRLEHQLSKQEILTRYLNTLYLGNGTYGIQAAAKYYFGVPAKALTLAQASMLAGMAPAPSVWNPVRSLSAARSRQLYTLNRMVANGYISSQEASDAYRTVPAILEDQGRPDVTATVAPEFADLVGAELRRSVGDDQLFRGGLRVTTTLDLDLQKAAVAALTQVLPNPKDPEAAIVAIDPRTGDIKAIATRPDAPYQRKRSFDLATSAERSSGSTIKPFTLAAALMAGKSVDDAYVAPHCKNIPNPGGKPDPYRVCNSPDEEVPVGPITLRRAMEQSVNTVYAPLADEIGQDKIRDVAIAAGLGPARNIGTNKAMALGVPVTPLSVAHSYATLLAHGVRRDVRSVLAIRSGGSGSADAGTVVRQEPADPKGVQAIPAEVADQVTDVLKGVVDRGTGTAAKQDFPVYGKTGTTDHTTNAWFVGCTHELCVATWMGYRDESLPDKTPHAMVGVEGVPEVYGGTLPAQIFNHVVDNYLAAHGSGPALFPAPVPTPPPPPPPVRKRQPVKRAPAPVASKPASPGVPGSPVPGAPVAPLPGAPPPAPVPAPKAPPPVVTKGPGP
ncbi:MAG: hypothetical protein NVSMB13_11440 [Mycobacteriales bacterium]